MAGAGLETCTGNAAVNYFNCIPTHSGYETAICRYGPTWGSNVSQWRHTVANLKQISDWTHN